MLLMISLDSLGAVILQYHHVAEDTPPITSISPDDFAKHMHHLESASFNVIGLPELVTALQAGRTLPDKTVAITFDDAYRNILDNATPILDRHGFPYTLFVATDLVGTSSTYLSWDQLRTLQQSGVTIGNHTASHPHLLRKNDGEDTDAWLRRVTFEITKATEVLDRYLEPTPAYFAYPYGEFDSRIIELVERLGYVGLGQQSGAVGASSDLRVLPRFPFSGRYTDLENFQIKAETKPMPIIQNTINPLLADGETLPALTLTFSRADLPFDQLTCYGPGGGRIHIQQQGPLTFTATPQQPVPVGRSRYNCTMPAGNDRFYWYSQLWIRKNPDGSWYPEP